MAAEAERSGRRVLYRACTPLAHMRARHCVLRQPRHWSCSCATSPLVSSIVSVQSGCGPAGCGAARAAGLLRLQIRARRRLCRLPRRALASQRKLVRLQRVGSAPRSQRRAGSRQMPLLLNPLPSARSNPRRMGRRRRSKLRGRYGRVAHRGCLRHLVGGLGGQMPLAVASVVGDPRAVAAVSPPPRPTHRRKSRHPRRAPSHYRSGSWSRPTSDAAMKPSGKLP